MGLALFVLGVIATTRYEKKEFLKLVKGQPVKAFGEYTVNFDSTIITPPENYYFALSVKEKNGDVSFAKPLWFWTDFNNHTSPIANPGILKYGSRDVYFTVVETGQTGGIPNDSLVRGETITLYDGAKTVKFVDFDFPPEEMAKMRSQQAFQVKARVNVFDGKDTTGIATPLVLSVTRNLATGEAKQEDVIIPNTSYHLQLAELRPDLSDRSKSKIIIASFDKDHPPPPAKDAITVEAFIKPYINLVWAGILIIVFGFYLSVIRRRREALVAIGKAEKAYEKILGRGAPSDEDKEPVALDLSRTHPTPTKKRSV
jgi:cytochrome c-type biogenesis protein CcmF